MCGSIVFIDEMQETKNQLETLGHEVKLPPSEIIDENGKAIPAKKYYALRKATNTTEGWIWDRKTEAMRNHFDKVMWAESILVLNYDKKNILNYIGANTLLEMGLAFHHGKKNFPFKTNPRNCIQGGNSWHAPDRHS
ncbi:MAG: hypothetical protein A3B74_02400 [Candidatus Kerfeldbacteria bacterium RIFCSPHIGHO2_02_FULL_42_14]|uniref:Uncharacterized protein n=1 Tax=Candidatus Kerfeldbacteria bacterium RIFCSPHIGHO2_02_FULL_42_14 TaxID=1798540 RepID=A0A1G2ARR2_9BACT|nr:MAG: hypothetical protein A3B74_02400 [Candidatus Kerfeldbacteria bacterium RIFCSPHIGHO2_02_FULL_42_14]OGY80395.1 MAG: hypothetical protein A3E60_05020 [Candidatus Kerfeldbacteria bacterium RIFCSPHIGHO2_12_FULL_42_13]OGY83824.1 MAG: hypothetical protein A3I91_04545 [Candidatus Kerfeldbacteria bacterium RIFCSPLOWO2_02_FULL_42_19]OGY85402.1 MAG: hypothetical protein A3G01_02320 [Candidatus Kerfeldbacteria bacterium RIFCSPLOWO2_12_FULL_43_9]